MDKDLGGVVEEIGQLPLPFKKIFSIFRPSPSKKILDPSLRWECGCGCENDDEGVGEWLGKDVSMDERSMKSTHARLDTLTRNHTDA
jgi:hypothetical protein